MVGLPKFDLNKYFKPGKRKNPMSVHRGEAQEVYWLKHLPKSRKGSLRNQNCTPENR